MKKIPEARLKKRPQCCRCRKKLSGAFQVCVCSRLYCPHCIEQEIHACTGPQLTEAEDDGRESESGPDIETKKVQEEETPAY